MNLTTLIRIGDELTESSTFGDRAVVGLQVVAIGMGVVFGVLILLIGILQLFKLFGGEKKTTSIKHEAKPVTTAPVATASASAGVSDEEKIVAIATAAIAASRGQSEVNFNVISIVPIGGAVSKADSNTVSAPSPSADVVASLEPASAPVIAGDGEKVCAPLPGNILDVKVANGASVKKGEILCILEAMKMENEIVAPVDGTVISTAATKGSSVNTGDLLFVIG